MPLIVSLVLLVDLWMQLLGLNVILIPSILIAIGASTGLLIINKALNYCIWHRLLIYFSLFSCVGMYFFLSDILIILLTLLLILILIGYFKYDKRDYKDTFKFTKKDSK